MRWLHRQPDWADVTSRQLLIRQLDAENSYVMSSWISVLGRSSPRTPKAFQSSLPLVEYVRGMAHDHILERGGAFRERGGVFRTLINAGKAWVIGYHECVALSAGELEPCASATNNACPFSPGHHLVATMEGQTKLRNRSRPIEVCRESIMPYVMLKYAPPPLAIFGWSVATTRRDRVKVRDPGNSSNGCPQACRPAWNDTGAGRSAIRNHAAGS